MKKRFIRLFMFATVIVSMGALNSCKDYDEDRINDLEHRLQDSTASLTELLNAQKNDLQKQIDDLNTAISNIKSCTCTGTTSCNCGDIDAKIAAALAGLTPGISAAEALQIANQAIADYMAAHPGLTATEVDHMIQTALSGIKSCTCTGDDLTTAQVSALIAQALADYAAAHPGLTAEEVQNMINTSLQNYAKISDLEDAKTALEAAYKDADEALKTDLLDQMTQALQTVNTAIATAQSKANDAYALAQTAKDNAQAAADAAGAADQKAQEALDKATAIETALSILSTELNNYKTYIEGEVTSAMTKATDALTLAQTNETLINGLVQTLTTLATKDEVAQADKNLQDQIDKLAEEAKNFATQQDIVATLRYAMDLYDQACQYADEAVAVAVQNLQNKIDETNDRIDDTNDRIDDTNNRIDNINITIADLDAAYKAADKYLQKQINTLNSDLTKLMRLVEANKTAIQNLKDEVEKLKNLMNRATGIVLQGTKNPAFGTFAMPFGVQSNVLIALHGENTVGVQKFPMPEYFPNATYETIKANATLLSDAGKLYLTVNPSDVDFSGAQLTLENSKGEASLFEMTPLTASDKTLKFGLTRGAAGFYEATVSVDKANLGAAQYGLNFVETMTDAAQDSKALATALIDYVKGKSNSGVAASAEDLANVINTILESMNMDALAVKGTWTDELGEHSITSNYGIAATAIRPLNFTSLDVLEGTTSVPGYARVMDLANRIYDKGESVIKNALNGISFSSLSMTSLNLSVNGTYTVDYHGSISTPVSVTIPAGDVTISGTGTMGSYTIDIYDNSGIHDAAHKIGEALIGGQTASVTGSNANNVTITTTANAPIDITIDITSTIQQIFADANANLGNINDLIDNINDMIAEIDNATDKITNATGDIQSSLNNWMSKLNNAGSRVLNKVARLTKPALIVVSDKGTTLAGFRGHAPVVSGKVTLVPTTYSLEYLAPVYKKYVTVNGQQVEVGENGKIENVTLQQGDNEIRYAALDYAGNQEIRIYHVTAE